MLSIYVQTSGGKPLEISVGKSETVKALKELINSKEGVPVEYQTLYTESDTEKKSPLHDDATLASLGIKSDQTLVLSTPTRGIVFKAPDVEKQTLKRTGTNTLHYWTVHEGLNYGGTCMTASCKAHKQKVMHHRGVGEINPNDDEHLDEVVRCPGCKEKFEVEGYFFYKCQVDITYKKSTDKTVTRVPTKRITGNDYWELGGDGAEKVDYVALKFVVTRL